MNGMEEDKDIQQAVTDGTPETAFNEMPHPQDELPTAVVRDYMIRDYQRLFGEYWQYREQAAMTEKQIESRALAIASRRKLETYELTGLKLKLAEKERKITEMYGWLSQKEALINSLRFHCEQQRGQLAVKDRNLTTQRRQIQSLLGHIGEDGKDVLAACDGSWNAERWKEAMVIINDVQQQLGELQEAVMQLTLDEGVKNAIAGAAKIIRKQARRAYNRTARIASTSLRREFSVETVQEDDTEENEDGLYDNK